MSGDLYLELQELIEKTEVNVKRLERYSMSYVSPVINEYRYALFHLVNSKVANPNSREDLWKAVGHMRRAYYDSCEILLDWLVCSSREYLDAARENAAISKICGISTKDYAKLLNEAVQWREKDGVDSQRQGGESVRDVQDIIDRLSKYQNTIRDCRFSVKSEQMRFRRERYRIWLSYLVSVISVILTISVSVLSWMGR